MSGLSLGAFSGREFWKGYWIYKVFRERLLFYSGEKAMYVLWRLIELLGLDIVGRRSLASLPRDGSGKDTRKGRIELMTSVKFIPGEGKVH